MRPRSIPIPGAEGASQLCRPVPVKLAIAYKDVWGDDEMTLIGGAEWTAREFLPVVVLDVTGLGYGDPYPVNGTTEERAEWWLSNADIAGIVECSSLALDGGRDVEGKAPAPDA